MKKWDHRFQVTVFANTSCQYTFYLIPTLVQLVALECTLLLVWGTFGIMVTHHAPKWLCGVFYVTALFAIHLFLAVGYPHLCRWLIRRIRHTPDGLRDFRLLQAAALVMTGGCVWFLWTIL